MYQLCYFSPDTSLTAMWFYPLRGSPCEADLWNQTVSNHEKLFQILEIHVFTLFVWQESLIK